MDLVARLVPARLVHGAGITALGYVMDEIYARRHATSRADFEEGLAPLVGKTAWTDGHWKFADGEVVRWDRIEKLSRAGLKFGNAVSSVTSEGAMRGLTRAARKAMSADLVPEWGQDMPPAASPNTQILDRAMFSSLLFSFSLGQSVRWLR